MATLRFTRLQRISNAGPIWEINLEAGLNLLIGDQNTSKTTTLRIIDFCLGDDKNARSKFGETIANEYSSFVVAVAIDGVQYTLTRRLGQPGQLRSVDVDDIVMNSDAFNEWIMSQLNWPMVYIPRGLNYSSVTDQIPLTFRTIYRHIYRRADSWTQFASQEFEYHRRAVVAFLLGVAEDIYAWQGLQVQITRVQTELSQLDQQRRELRETIDDIIRRATEGYWSEGTASLSSIQQVIDDVEEEIRSLQDAREALAQGIRAQPGYDAEQDTELNTLNSEIDQLSRDVSLVEGTIAEQRVLAETLEGDKLRIHRALVSTKALSSILVTGCPACLQPVNPSQDGRDTVVEHCYLCRQSIRPDTRQRRLTLEEQAVTQEQLELQEVIRELERRLIVQQDQLQTLAAEREVMLRAIEEERRHLVSPRLREFEHIQFQLGQLNQRLELLSRLAQLQQRIDAPDQRRHTLESEQTRIERDVANHPSSRGLILERTSRFADYMNEFLDRLPTSEVLGGTVSIDPQDLGFYVGREVWDNALGDERRVLFFLAYHYAYLRLASEGEIPYPGVSILDNPFQQDVKPELVESGLRILHDLCDGNPALQVIVATRRDLSILRCHRVYFGRVFNPEDDGGLAG